LIGSNLCEELLRRCHEVICADNLSTGSRRNLEAFAGHPSFDFVHHDVVQELPPFPRLDRIYHLASPASPIGYSRLPIETLRANSEGTLRLLQLARIHKARFLYSSTSEIYGDPLTHPQPETYRGNVSCTGPRSMYDESKRYGEALAMAFVRTHGVDARVVRIFNTYGPRCGADDGRMIANLITQALRGEPLTIYGNGRQTRSLCFVSDMVVGLIEMMESPSAKGEVVNLGNPDERSVLEYAQLIRDLTGSTSKLVFGLPAVGDDPQQRRPDIRKAESLLGWSPRVGLEKGLLETIAYFRGRLRDPAARQDVAMPAPNGTNGAHAVNGTHGTNGVSAPRRGRSKKA
jgi:dTDP-glucose 4,6-dehydratase/UDP-glucuronate decarboxylase